MRAKTAWANTFRLTRGQRLLCDRCNHRLKYREKYYKIGPAALCPKCWSETQGDSDASLE